MALHPFQVVEDWDPQTWGRGIMGAKERRRDGVAGSQVQTGLPVALQASTSSLLSSLLCGAPSACQATVTLDLSSSFLPQAHCFLVSSGLVVGGLNPLPTTLLAA